MTEIKHNLLTYAMSQFENPNAVIENINNQLIEQIGKKQIQHLKVTLHYKNSSHDEKKIALLFFGINDFYIASITEEPDRVTFSINLVHRFNLQKNRPQSVGGFL